MRKVKRLEQTLVSVPVANYEKKQSRMFPSIGEYNQVIQFEGGGAFRSLTDISFIPSRLHPIKVYLFGSGSYAAVFKGSQYGKCFAIRCFITADSETMDRYKTIAKYLKNVIADWKTECEFIENELTVNGNSFPILKMEWIEGGLINQFISNNLADNKVLGELQRKLVTISNNLETNKIGHGDLQCGNIIVTGNATDFQIKLIDYDGMYVPELASKKCLEKGRSEFQHPKRNENNFNFDIDRFSFWVMITALEALKFDKLLWLEVMQGGFNTLDNFLFTLSDFQNAGESVLVKKLTRLNEPSINYYLEKLLFFCNGEISNITKPELYGSILHNSNVSSESQNYPADSTGENASKTISGECYKIISNNGSAAVLSSSFQKLGMTPIQLEKNIYTGKTILISNGKETIRITLRSTQNLVEVIFLK